MKPVNFLEAFKANETNKTKNTMSTGSFCAGEMKKCSHWYPAQIFADWEIIEEPMEVWVNYYGILGDIFYSEIDAKNNCPKGGVTKKFREVV